MARANGRAPRSLTVEPMPAMPAAAGDRLHSPAEFAGALFAFGALWMRDLIGQGVFTADSDGDLRVRKDTQ